MTDGGTGVPGYRGTGGWNGGTGEPVHRITGLPTGTPAPRHPGSPVIINFKNSMEG